MPFAEKLPLPLEMDYGHTVLTVLFLFLTEKNEKRET